MSIATMLKLAYKFDAKLKALAKGPEPEESKPEKFYYDMKMAIHRVRTDIEQDIFNLKNRGLSNHKLAHELSAIPDILHGLLEEATTLFPYRAAGDMVKFVEEHKSNLQRLEQVLATILAKSTKDIPPQSPKGISSLFLLAQGLKQQIEEASPTTFRTTERPPPMR